MKLAKLSETDIFEMPIPYNDWYEGVPYSNLHLVFLADIELANSNGWYELCESQPEVRDGYYYTPTYKMEGNCIVRGYDEHLIAPEESVSTI